MNVCVCVCVCVCVACSLRVCEKLVESQAREQTKLWAFERKHSADPTGLRRNTTLDSHSTEYFSNMNLCFEHAVKFAIHELLVENAGVSRPGQL